MKDVKEKENRELQIALKGYIYEFLDKDGTTKGNHILIVSSNSHRLDKFVNMIMLSDFNNGENEADTVALTYMHNNVPCVKYAKCGAITYCLRERVGKVVTSLDKESLDNVMLGISSVIGIVPNEEVTYKKLYQDLLKQVLERDFKGVRV